MPAELRTVDGQISKRRRLGPQVIGCYALNSDLSSYLREQVQHRWSWCRVDSTNAPDALTRWRVDLWLSANVPSPLPARPLLLLSLPASTKALRRTGPGLWELPAPYHGDEFIAAVEQIWRESLSSAELR